MELIQDREIFVKLLLTGFLFVIWGTDVDGWKVNRCKTGITCNT